MIDEPDANDGWFWFLGGRVRVLVDSASTGGALSVMEFDDPQGLAPPMHLHDREVEVFTLVSGAVSVFVADRRTDLEPGQVVAVPRGVPHSYLVRSERARLVATYVPGGLEGWFTANGSPFATGEDEPPPPDIPAIIASGQNFGVHIAGPAPTMPGGFSATYVARRE